LGEIIVLSSTKDDITQFMAQTDELMDLLAEKYGIE
jgi:hypothetical protein